MASAPPPTTRDRIVDAAIGCFAARGVDETSLEVVAHAAGVHRVTLHRTFPGGRDELIVAVLDHSIERMVAQVRIIVAKAPSAAEAAVEAATHVVVVTRGDPALLRTVRSLDAQQAALSSAATPLQSLVAELWGLVAERAAATGELVVGPGTPLFANHWSRVLIGLATNPVGLETPVKVRRYLRTFVVPALVRPPA